MKYLSALVSVLFAFLLIGCAASDNSRATGQFIDDATITAKVKTEIAQTAGIGDAAAINVDTYRGVVSLAGFIDNAEQAQTAMQAAKRVNGVAEVKNNLVVKPRK
jgi:osmotically-inducible protein OsmY